MFDVVAIFGSSPSRAEGVAVGPERREIGDRQSRKQRDRRRRRQTAAAIDEQQEEEMRVDGISNGSESGGRR
jgi:hypothetical protein